MSRKISKLATEMFFFCIIVLDYCRMVKDVKIFRKHCHNYFMEVVSTLCFGGQSAPEPALIQMLMESFFTTEGSLTFLSDGKKETSPVIKSSLLQLLLEHE